MLTIFTVVTLITSIIAWGYIWLYWRDEKKGKKIARISGIIFWTGFVLIYAYFSNERTLKLGPRWCFAMGALMWFLSAAFVLIKDYRQYTRSHYRHKNYSKKITLQTTKLSHRKLHFDPPLLALLKKK